MYSVPVAISPYHVLQMQMLMYIDMSINLLGKSYLGMKISLKII